MRMPKLIPVLISDRDQRTPPALADGVRQGTTRPA
jgi:hypothetical protein